MTMISAATKAVPNVPGKPLIGSLVPFFWNRFGFMEQMSRDYGEIARLKIGPLSLVFINSAELFQDLMVERMADFEKGEMQARAFRPVLGDALNIAEGQEHRQRRKLVAPVFQPRHLSSYADTIVAYTDKAQGRWSNHTTLELFETLQNLALEIMGKLLFDYDSFDQTDPLWQAVTTATGYLDYQFTHLVPLPLSWPTLYNRKVRPQLALLNSRIYSLIKQRRAYQEDHGDLLSKMLECKYEDGTGIDDLELRNDIMFTLIAGYDNTSAALAWTFYLLTQNPEAYHKLQQEVDQVLGERVATYADLPQLTYATQVFKEALRLYPVSSLMARLAKTDTQLGAYPIRKGEMVVLSPLVFHHHPDVYAQPERFEPERFSPENERKIPRYAYLPFGLGTRTCIGNHFSMIEGVLLIATLAKAVTLELVPGQQIVPIPKEVLRAKNGIQVSVNRR